MNIEALENVIGLKFGSKDLLIEAISHASYINEIKEDNRQSYERLEFLGDSILSFIVGEYFIKNFPKANEGELSRFRSRAVQGPALEFVARELGISPFILVGKGIKEDPNARLPLDDVYEAIIGAIYLDKGIEEARRFIYKSLIAKLDILPVEKDYKTLLQELYQKEKRFESLSYKLINTEGEKTKIFTVKLTLGNEFTFIARGKSIKEAETFAAKKALERLSYGQK